MICKMVPGTSEGGAEARAEEQPTERETAEERERREREKYLGHSFPDVEFVSRHRKVIIEMFET